MLPITNHRVLHVPHSLAIGAAVVGLVVALSWDRPEIEHEPALMSGSATITIEDDRADELDKIAPRPDSSPDRGHGGRELLPGFGPLVLPISPGRG